MKAISGKQLCKLLESRGWQADEAMAFIAALQKQVRTGGRKFTRDEMNER